MPRVHIHRRGGRVMLRHHRHGHISGGLVPALLNGGDVSSKLSHALENIKIKVEKAAHKGKKYIHI